MAARCWLCIKLFWSEWENFQFCLQIQSEQFFLQKLGSE